MIAFVGLILAFISILVVLNRWQSFGLAMLSGSLILAIFGGFTYQSALRIFWQSATHPGTLRLIAIVLLINLMGYVLKQTGSLEKLVDTIIKGLKDVRLVVVAVPALIGMLPVPGGAVMSAPMACGMGSHKAVSFIHF